MFVLLLGLGTVLLFRNLQCFEPSLETESQANNNSSVKRISGLPELKNESDTIVEIVGTDKYKVIDYKGAQSIITTVKVLSVIKGDKNLKEAKIIQLYGEMTPKNGEKLLMFLRKGIDNPDCYVPIGSGQGIYKIVQSKTKDNSSNNSLNNMILEPQSMVNDDILKDLTGDFETIKKKLSE